ncbi:MAG TPA: P-loop NTPase [Thermoanaerobaculia bacterium]|nr:P-loop NTPase [Thermoanaerobaculia bacterium]
MKTYRDIDGDGGSDILGQVVAQRGRIAANLSGVKRLVGVGSGKGGVGKSTLTTLLALELTRRGRECAILDADLNGPSQAQLAGVPSAPPVPGELGLLMPRGRGGFGVVSLGSLLPPREAFSLPSVAEGDSYVWRATREFTLLGELLAGVEWGRLDVLLIDLPPGAERAVQYAEALGPQLRFVLATIPSDLARGVVARSVDALKRTPNPLLGYVENMSGYYCHGCNAVRPLFASAPGREHRDPIGLERLGSLPFDPVLAEQCDRGLAGSPGGPVGLAVAEIAEKLLARLDESAPAGAVAAGAEEVR